MSGGTVTNGQPRRERQLEAPLPPLAGTDYSQLPFANLGKVWRDETQQSYVDRTGKLRLTTPAKGWAPKPGGKGAENVDRRWVGCPGPSTAAPEWKDGCWIPPHYVWRDGKKVLVDWSKSCIYLDRLHLEENSTCKGCGKMWPEWAFRGCREARKTLHDVVARHVKGVPQFAGHTTASLDAQTQRQAKLTKDIEAMQAQIALCSDVTLRRKLEEAIMSRMPALEAERTMATLGGRLRTVKKEYDDLEAQHTRAKDNLVKMAEDCEGP